MKERRKRICQDLGATLGGVLHGNQHVRNSLERSTSSCFPQISVSGSPSLRLPCADFSACQPVVIAVRVLRLFPVSCFRTARPRCHRRTVTAIIIAAPLRSHSAQRNPEISASLGASGFLAGACSVWRVSDAPSAGCYTLQDSFPRGTAEEATVSAPSREPFRWHGHGAAKKPSQKTDGSVAATQSHCQPCIISPRGRPHRLNNNKKPNTRDVFWTKGKLGSDALISSHENGCLAPPIR